MQGYTWVLYCELNNVTVMARAQHRKDIRDEERRADWFLERKHRRGDDGRDKVHIVHSLRGRITGKVAIKTPNP
jgi:hypothetical protein